MDDKSKALQDLVRRKDVRLLKASVVARLLAEGQLKDLNRQSLEKKNSQAFANSSLVGRCLKEAEVAATRKQCAYPGIVVVSHVWQTAAHPDPSGSLGKKLALYLHWYAAQRAKWTKERLYKAKNQTSRSDRINDVAFDVDFCVLIDFWSLHQAPRNDKQDAGFVRAQQTMHLWLGHRGVTVFLVTAAPTDWTDNQEYRTRGGYEQRGWTTFERRVAVLCEGGGICMDMGGFDQMLAKAKGIREEPAGSRVGDVFGSKASQFSGRFEGMKDYQLTHLAMWDRSGHSSRERVLDGAFALGESCLVQLVQGRRLPPVSPAEMEHELANKAFSNAADKAICLKMYREVAVEVLGKEEVLDFDGVSHWSVTELRSVGGAMVLCGSLRLLKLNHCEIGSAEIAAFAEELKDGAAPELEELEIRGNEVGEEGLEALGKAVARGAMPRLRRIIGVATAAMRDGWEQRVAAATGHGVSHDEGMLTIQTPMTRNEARHVDRKSVV